MVKSHDAPNAKAFDHPALTQCITRKSDVPPRYTEYSTGFHAGRFENIIASVSDHFHIREYENSFVNSIEELLANVAWSLVPLKFPSCARYPIPAPWYVGASTRVRLFPLPLVSSPFPLNNHSATIPREMDFLSGHTSFMCDASISSGIIMRLGLYIMQFYDNSHE